MLGEGASSPPGSAEPRHAANAEEGLVKHLLAIGLVVVTAALPGCGGDDESLALDSGVDGDSGTVDAGTAPRDGSSGGDTGSDATSPADGGEAGTEGDAGPPTPTDHNEVAGNAVGYEAKFNCGCSGGMKFYTSTNATITNNWIHDNGSVGSGSTRTTRSISSTATSSRTAKTKRS
jgi:hypothetical protein